MFRTSSYGVVGAKVVALKAMHTGHAHFGSQVRIFARTFHHTAPAGIAADVDHRSKSPVDTNSRSLDGRNPCRLFNSFQVPAGSLGQRYWRNRFMPVNHIKAKDQRNTQPCFFYRNFLQGTNLIHAANIQKRTNHPAAEMFVLLLCIAITRGWPGCIVKTIVLNHLPHFLFKGHLVQ